MKKFFAILAIAGAMTACNNAADNNAGKTDTTVTTNVDTTNKVTVDTTNLTVDTANKATTDTTKAK